VEGEEEENKKEKTKQPEMGIFQRKFVHMNEPLIALVK
jgi:hypothetical protein